MITLSEIAANEVKHIISSQLERQIKEAQAAGEEIDDNVPFFLRVGVKGGGCSGYNYTLDLTTQYDEEQDEMFEHHGIKVVCDAKSYIYLNGVSIDFRDEVMGRGFLFNNPNATSKCGCGSSFSV